MQPLSTEQEWAGRGMYLGQAAVEHVREQIRKADEEREYLTVITTDNWKRRNEFILMKASSAMLVPDANKQDAYVEAGVSLEMAGEGLYSFRWRKSGQYLSEERPLIAVVADRALPSSAWWSESRRQYNDFMHIAQKQIEQLAAIQGTPSQSS